MANTTGQAEVELHTGSMRKETHDGAGEMAGSGAARAGGDGGTAVAGSRLRSFEF